MDKYDIYKLIECFYAEADDAQVANEDFLYEINAWGLAAYIEAHLSK